MATISKVYGTTTHAANKRVPYLVERTFSLVDIPANDVVEAIAVPAETIVLAAGVEYLTAVTGLTTPALLLGYGGDTDEWAASHTAASAAYATPVGDGTAGAVHKIFTSADTIDLVVGAASGTVTAGVARVWALMIDISGVNESSTHG
jgi:hypothetical protein